MSAKYIDGYVFKSKYGDIRLLRRLEGKSSNKGIFLCHCGESFEVLIRSVASGHTKSCGCFLKRKKYCNGHTFQTVGGKITLLERLFKNNQNQYIGLFLCYCGNTFKTKVSYVANGQTTSCGCGRIKHKEGHTFNTKGGTLKLLKRIDSESIPRGLFQCYCGKQFETYINSVVIGDTHSCGCYHSEQIRDIGKWDIRPNSKKSTSKKNNNKKYSDGYVFKTKAGNLTLLYRTKTTPPYKAMFKCFCGKEFETFIASVTQGDTHSCGCFKYKSISEIGKSNKGKKKVIF